MIIYQPDASVVTGLVVVVLLLLLSALVSGSEVAYFSLKPADIEKLKASKSKRAPVVLNLHGSPENLLSTILIANNFINIAIIVIAAWVGTGLFDFTGNDIVSFIVEVLIITALLLFFGEILPKVYATRNNLGFALFMALFLRFASRLLRPAASALMLSSSYIKRRSDSNRGSVSMDDLSDAIDLTAAKESEDEKILKGIVKFGNISVSAIMTPRVDIMALNIKCSFRDILPPIFDSGFSRIPVYENSLDSVKGLLYVKDILPHIDKHGNFRWQNLIRKPYFVPEAKKINELLKEFQVKKSHMAVVVDEYGGTSGIITLEDILEEIVGEITDETDEEEMIFKQEDDSSYIFLGKTLLNDFCKILDIEEDLFDEVRGESETLAGLILELTGEIPQVTQTLEHGPFLFEIISVDKRRIKEIKVTIVENRGKNID